MAIRDLADILNLVDATNEAACFYIEWRITDDETLMVITKYHDSYDGEPEMEIVSVSVGEAIEKLREIQADLEHKLELIDTYFSKREEEAETLSPVDYMPHPDVSPAAYRKIKRPLQK